MAGMKRALEDRFDPRADWGTCWPTSWLCLACSALRASATGRRAATGTRVRVSADRHIVITGRRPGWASRPPRSWRRASGADARGSRCGKAKRVAQDLRRRFGNRRMHVELAELSLLEDVRALARAC